MMVAKISELKARLSSYLAAVRRGETVVVNDRWTPVAKIVPYEEDRGDLRIREPLAPLEDLRKIKGVRPRTPLDVVADIRADRDAR